MTLDLATIAPPSCPRCQSATRLRTGSRGPFFGCSKYPNCKGVVDAADAILSNAGSGALNPSSSHNRGNNPGRLLNARFAGKCACGAAVAQGDSILYADKRVIGCSACNLGGSNSSSSPTVKPAASAPAVFTLDDTPEEAEQRSALAQALAAAAATPVADLGGERGVILPMNGSGDSSVLTPSVLTVSDERRSQIAPCAFTLDPHQLAVVGWRTGEALAAAGAGSGKSTVLIERIAELVRSGELPENILTLVYNRSAADGLKSRLQVRLGSDLGSRCSAFTFHGWAYAILRAWNPGDVRFRTERIVGLDDGPSKPRLAGKAMKAAGLSGDWKTLCTASEQIREALIDLDSPKALELIAETRVAGGDEFVADTLHKFARAFQAIKADEKAIDFADMLYMVAREIADRTPRAMELAARYCHVQIDEAQDINPARLAIAAHLGSGAKSLVMVGDLRQSIYGFTGARPDLFKGRLDAGATLLTLPVNRRSTAAIVTCGNAIADGRDWNLGGACEPAPGREAGEPVSIWRTESPADEAAAVADEVLARVARGLPLAINGKSSYACLVRTNAQATSLEAAFLSRSVSVRVLGTQGGVWMTGPGREVLAYLRGAEGIAHDDLARIANKGGRRIKRDDIERLVRQAKEKKGNVVSFLMAAQSSFRPGTPDRQMTALARELSMLSRLNWTERTDAIRDMLVQDLAERAAEVSERVGKTESPDEDKEAAYKALCAAARTAGSVKAIEEQIAVMQRTGKDEPAVEISTIHKAKGQEWAVVFTCGCADGLLPHEKCEDEEEERRLFYVAVTRAKDVAILSVGSSDSDGNLNPSPFLSDIGFNPDDGGGPRTLVKLDPAAFAAAREGLTKAEREAEEVEHVAGLADRLTAVEGDHDAEWALLAGAVAAHGVDAVEAELAPAQASIFAGAHADDATKMPAEVPVTVNPLPLMLAEARPLATWETTGEPHATEGEGGRFVDVLLPAMTNLMHAVGFCRASMEVEKAMGQVTFERAHEGQVIRVYTTIPLSAAVARGCGEDSIKVAGIHVDSNGKGYPLHKRLPYAARTRGWRVTLLDRIEEVAEIIRQANTVKCTCGAPMIKRQGRNGSSFFGCTRFPACKATRRVDSTGELP